MARKKEIEEKKKNLLHLKKEFIALKMINQKLYRKQEKYHDLKGRRKLFWIIINITIPHTS